jgi:hypothetical protein
VALVCIELIEECGEVGTMSDRAHVALVEAVQHLQKAEYWQLKNQERHAGKNAATDKQIAICRAALPALEQAVEALGSENYSRVIKLLSLAATTDGEQKPVKKTRKKSLREPR